MRRQLTGFNPNFPVVGRMRANEAEFQSLMWSGGKVTTGNSSFVMHYALDSLILISSGCTTMGLLSVNDASSCLRSTHVRGSH